MSRFIARLLVALVRGLAPLVGARRVERALARLAVAAAPERRVVTRHGPVVFHGATTGCLYYADKLADGRDPMFAWIDGFVPGAVLWDIGANVGLFSLYAGARGDLTVLAFEPGAASYAVLNRNLARNGLNGRVRAYCLAFGDATGAGTLAVSSLEPGTVGHEYGGDGKAFEQGTLGFTIDDFIARYDPPFPDHVKIDVDNIEDAILAGAARTLADPRLKSVYMEVHDSERGRRARALLLDAGFVETGDARPPAAGGDVDVCFVRG